MSGKFVALHREGQGAYFTEQHGLENGLGGSPYRLVPDAAGLNLAPAIRDDAARYFAEKGITWHRHANHGLSSQVCCLNFLMPLAHDPAALARVVGQALDIAPPKMLPMEQDEASRDWYVAFEWIGERDYLNEAGKNGTRTRGANATSADAAVRFRSNGRIEIALIEWKFTESYGAPIPSAGNPTRVARYRDIVFAPAGPIRNNLGLTVEDFFWDPFYQMLRQQMLAVQMQRAGELGAERVRLLHISPAGNAKLHKVTAPALRKFGTDAFAVFASLLTEPKDFVSRSIEAVFAPQLDNGPAEWATYLRDRYPLFWESEA
ncbi:MAG: hypothetical protein EON59_09090 [Alphaproteobacteria bacterium]|nr:MAG: hypothetical protein EON59_09090 [Alphaproteobacteria bacterium]